MKRSDSPSKPQLVQRSIESFDTESSTLTAEVLRSELRAVLEQVTGIGEQLQRTCEEEIRRGIEGLRRELHALPCLEEAAAARPGTAPHLLAAPGAIAGRRLPAANGQGWFRREPLSTNIGSRDVVGALDGADRSGAALTGSLAQPGKLFWKHPRKRAPQQPGAVRASDSSGDETDRVEVKQCWHTAIDDSITIAGKPLSMVQAAARTSPKAVQPAAQPTPQDLGLQYPQEGSSRSSPEIPPSKMRPMTPEDAPLPLPVSRHGMRLVSAEAAHGPPVAAATAARARVLHPTEEISATSESEALPTRFSSTGTMSSPARASRSGVVKSGSGEGSRLRKLATSNSIKDGRGRLSFAESVGTLDTEKLESMRLRQEFRSQKGQKLSLGLELAKMRASQVDNFRLMAPWTWRAKDVLHSARFDNFISLCILMNAISIGIEADIAARNITDVTPVIFRVCELAFCAVFTTELVLRLWVDKWRFLCKKEWGVLWNFFDLTVVGAQLFQEILTIAENSELIDVSKFRLLRVLRVLRIVRIFRLVRVLHLISELRTIVSSMMGSFKALGWTVVLLFLMIYIVSVFFTQTITDHFVNNNLSLDSRLSEGEYQLRYYYGSLLRTILSLWQSISDGADWDTMAHPMISEVQPLLGFMFAAYIAFAMLALMNVVTGVFVQTALSSAQSEEDSFLRDQIVSLFHMSVRDEFTKISLAEIFDRIDDPQAAKEWKLINISSEEAKYLFELLDVMNTGEVVFEEFLGACIRLRGPAKSIDLLTVMQEARLQKRMCNDRFESVEDQQVALQAKLEELMAVVMQQLEQQGEEQALAIESIKGIGDQLQAMRRSVRLVKKDSMFSDMFGLVDAGTGQEDEV